MVAGGASDQTQVSEILPCSPRQYAGIFHPNSPAVSYAVLSHPLNGYPVTCYAFTCAGKETRKTGEGKATTAKRDEEHHVPNGKRHSLPRSSPRGPLRYVRSFTLFSLVHDLKQANMDTVRCTSEDVEVVLSCLGIVVLLQHRLLVLSLYRRRVRYPLLLRKFPVVQSTSDNIGNTHLEHEK